jgi:hypothetical protein
MNADEQQEISERDQLWASLRALRPEIERLASGETDDVPRRQLLSMMLAKIVVAELQFRDRDSASDEGNIRPNEE